VPDQIEEAWRLLEAQGATVRRLPLAALSRAEAEALLWHLRRRLRALMERHAPDPPPFNWRAYRVSLVARPAAYRNAPTAAYLRREAA
jgi:hypothetical protein